MLGLAFSHIAVLGVAILVSFSKLKPVLGHTYPDFNILFVAIINATTVMLAAILIELAFGTSSSRLTAAAFAALFYSVSTSLSLIYRCVMELLHKSA